ncbi:MAG: DUF309 domain-containing protein [Anaerolineales bacterium]|nr:DUF309 domain-containing protein [Anaerolineales bacterium]
MNTLFDERYAPLHPSAIEGLRLFNNGKYFEAHEALETAWLEERGKIRDLYRGILQVGVAYLHITRGNYNGAIKVYGRSLKWLRDWSPTCRGVYVEELRRNAETALDEVARLGKGRIKEFDLTLLKPIRWREDLQSQFITAESG